MPAAFSCSMLKFCPLCHEYAINEASKVTSKSPPFKVFISSFLVDAYVATTRSRLFRGTERRATMTSPSLMSLAPETLTAVFSFLDKRKLRDIRLSNPWLCRIATPLLFRVVRLSTHFMTYDYSYVPINMRNFVNIAQSDKLRPLVREVECMIEVGDVAEKLQRRLPPHSRHVFFLEALPLLRNFPRLSFLRVQLEGEIFTLSDNAFAFEKPSAKLRFRILDTIFRSVAGTWSSERQSMLNSFLGLNFDKIYNHQLKPLHSPSAGPLCLQALSLVGIGPLDYHLFKGSAALAAILESSHFVNLSLSCEPRFTRGPSKNNGLESYGLFEHLSLAWLSPPVAQNLRVLMLHSRTEKMRWWHNLEPISLPHLKVLGLELFMFSRQQQVDWVASLGKSSASKGLEEIYLVDCRVLFHATIKDPEDGQEHSSSFSLRWHTVLDCWTNSVPSLRGFDIGAVGRNPFERYRGGAFVGLTIIPNSTPRCVATQYISFHHKYDSKFIPREYHRDFIDDSDYDEAERILALVEDDCEAKDQAALLRLLNMVEVNRAIDAKTH
ncbi:hypothetical protein G7046_g4956 [Stylonectria norvegica]|nr:hypothetical protein G7046_g4956 [Stylonectria norvegica]